MHGFRGPKLLLFFQLRKYFGKYLFKREQSIAFLYAALVPTPRAQQKSGPAVSGKAPINQSTMGSSVSPDSRSLWKASAVALSKQPAFSNAI